MNNVPMNSTDLIRDLERALSSCSRETALGAAVFHLEQLAADSGSIQAYCLEPFPFNPPVCRSRFKLADFEQAVDHVVQAGFFIEEFQFALRDSHPDVHRLTAEVFRHAERNMRKLEALCQALADHKIGRARFGSFALYRSLLRLKRTGRDVIRAGQELNKQLGTDFFVRLREQEIALARSYPVLFTRKARGINRPIPADPQALWFMKSMDEDMAKRGSEGASAARTS